MIKNSVMLTHVKRENLFLNHLKQIGDMNFTLREIDIIACIINNRGDKKIAFLLSISPRTVSTHVRNIMLKLNCNSKESIIDFVEKYGKTKIFRQYYAELLSEASFNNYLAKIKKLLNNNDITIDIITKESAIAKNIPLLQQLKKHLALANIVLEINSVTEKSKSTSRTVQLDLYLENSSENISLVFNKNTKSKTIDFRDEDNYYFLVTELLSSIIDKAEINKINDEFILDYQSILASNTDFTISEKIISETQQYNIKSNHFGILIFLIIGGCIFFYFNLDHLKQKAIILTETENIYKTMPKFFEDLSVRNLTKEEAEKNYSIIKQFDWIVKEITLGRIQTHFDGNILQPGELVNCLYNLNAISSYALFKEHDAEKAIKLLNYAKYLAENYVSTRSKLAIDFDKLTPAEVYTELSVIQDFPEMYTITLYFLGRSFIYQKNIEYAEKYFKLSKALGNKLELFEEVLSTINGLAIIKTDQADINIKQGNYSDAEKNIKECINTYEDMWQDGKTYKKNYRPSNYNPSIITPKGDIYHIIDCSKRITKLYTKLTEIADDKLKLESYMEAVYHHFIGNEASQGILKILIHSSDKLSRIAADSYNSLGYFLLKLYDKDTSLKKFNTSLVSQLHLTDGSNLEVIYQLFDLAKSLSRSTEFSKADAYNGLVLVTERMLHTNNIMEEQKKELLLKIQEFKKARDLINKALKRI